MASCEQIFSHDRHSVEEGWDSGLDEFDDLEQRSSMHLPPSSMETTSSSPLNPTLDRLGQVVAECLKQNRGLMRADRPSLYWFQWQRRVAERSWCEVYALSAHCSTSEDGTRHTLVLVAPNLSQQDLPAAGSQTVLFEQRASDTGVVPEPLKRLDQCVVYIMQAETRPLWRRLQAHPLCQELRYTVRCGHLEIICRFGHQAPDLVIPLSDS